MGGLLAAMDPSPFPCPLDGRPASPVLLPRLPGALWLLRRLSAGWASRLPSTRVPLAGRPVVAQETILVNPEIVAKSSRTDTGQEGCLSFPGVYADVEASLGSHMLWGLPGTCHVRLQCQRHSGQQEHLSDGFACPAPLVLPSFALLLPS